MLSGSLRERRDKVGENETLEDFGGGTEERDGTVGCGEVGGFSGFGDGDDGGALPDGRELGVGNREVEEGGEVGESAGTEMLEVEHRDTIWPDGG